MKFIYSFNSKPIIDNWREEGLGSFSSEEQRIDTHLEMSKLIFLKSLSSLKTTFGENVDVELFTDDIGCKIFCDIKGLRINNSLLKIKNYNKALWAVGKILSLSNQSEPVIHLDMDFIIKDHKAFFNIVNENWDILVQSKETYGHYKTLYSPNVEIFLNILFQDQTGSKYFKLNTPEFLYYLSYAYAYNCGVIGFKNLNALQKYTKNSLRIYNIFNSDSSKIIKYAESFNLISIYNRPKAEFPLDINCLIEQWYLTIFSHYYNFYVKEVAPLSVWNNFQEGYAKSIENVSSIYFHPVGEELACKFKNIMTMNDNIRQEKER